MVGLVICKTYSTANAEAVMEHIELEEPSVVWIWNLWLQLYEVCPHIPPPSPILWPLKPYWTCTVPTVVLVPPLPDSCQTTANLIIVNHTRLYHHCPTSDTMDFIVTAWHQTQWTLLSLPHIRNCTLLSLPDIRHNGLYCHCLTLDTVLYCHCQTSNTLDFTVTARHQTLDFTTTAWHQKHWTLPPLLVIKRTGLYHHCQISDTVDFYCHYLAIISSAPPPPPFAGMTTISHTWCLREQ